MKDEPDIAAAVTEQVFVALQAQKGITTQPQTQDSEKPVMFADVLHYVVGSSAIDVTKVGNAINSDLKLRRIYKQLLGQNRVAFGPREAHAQGEEEIALRNGEGFCIKLKVSKANAKQVYVILTVEQPEQFKSDKAIALHVTSEQTQFRLDFPALVDGKSQSIVASDDERLTALKNINTELSLV